MVAKRKVIVYSTEWCPYCVVAKDYLKSKSVEFEDVNVEENPAAAEEMVAKSGQNGIPVLDIGGRIIVGFNKHAIDSALAGA